ncbi:hypothetical protein YC2023_063545 [Brassica napus]
MQDIWGNTVGEQATESSVARTGQSLLGIYSDPEMVSIGSDATFISRDDDNDMELRELWSIGFMQNHDQLIQSYMDIQSPNHVGWKNMGFFMTIHYHITDKMVVKECQLKSPLALPSPVILCSRLNISKVSSKKWVERVEDEDRGHEPSKTNKKIALSSLAFWLNLISSSSSM